MNVQILGGRPDPNRNNIIHRALVTKIDSHEDHAVQYLALSRSRLANRLRLRPAGKRSKRSTLRYFHLPTNGRLNVFDCSMPKDPVAQKKIERELYFELSKIIRELAKHKGKVRWL